MARKKAEAPDPTLFEHVADPAVEIDLLLQMRDALVDLAPADDAHFIQYVETYYGFRLPVVTGCPTHTPPGVVWCDLFFGRVNDAIVIGSRDSGKTWGFAMLTHAEQGLLRIDIANVGAIQAQADKGYSYYQGFCGLPWFRHRLAKASMMSRTYNRDPQTGGQGALVEIMPATIGRVNSPHPQHANWDEIELTTWKIISEGQSMPSRKGDIAPAVRYTSSRKKPYGPLERLLKEAGKRGLTVYTWCLEGSTPVYAEHGEKPIREIAVGDRVWSWNGASLVLASVSASQLMGRRPCVRVRFADRELVCTADHEIATSRGWVAAGELIEGDFVLSDLRNPNERAKDALLLATLAGGEASGILRAAPTVPELRWPETQALETLRQVLCGPTWTHESGTQRVARSGQGERGSARAASAVTDRDSGGVAVRVAPLADAPRGDDWVAPGRLSARADEHGDRGLRLAPFASGARPDRRGEAGQTGSPGLQDAGSMVGSNRDVGPCAPSLLCVTGVEQAGHEDVYDLTVPGTHNFVANGIVVHNCVFCVMEKCPESRHQGGAGCRSGYCPTCETPRPAGSECPKCSTKLAACPLAEDCLYAKSTVGGDTVYEDGPGRAAKADGFYKIIDAIRQKGLMDRDTWVSQWLSMRPKQEGLIYPMFDKEIHVIPDDAYEWNPNLPVYAGQDFGFTAPGAVVYAQMLPTNELVVFAEDYTAGRITPIWAKKIKAQPWFPNIKWVMADPAAKDQRETEIDAGVPVEMANNEREDGFARIRYLLAPPGREVPLLFISERCVNLIAEMSTYHHPEVKVDKNPDEDAQEVDDHACDALRYLVTELYGGQIKL